MFALLTIFKQRSTVQASAHQQTQLKMLPFPRLLSAAVKPLLQLCLLTIFLVFFGWPSLLRYREEAIMVITHVLDTGGIEAPAITMASR